MPGSASEDLESGQENGKIVLEKAEDDSVVDWNGPDDPENPRNWSPLKRNVHVTLVSVYTLWA
jgi:hypothetical protein